ncbi:beta-N-acetylhexosaminidase [Dyadobacter fermentans]|uniref:beta-N-acetylhexosaminidase n=1 Tax=Dyadobacter fermentans (strain ATCC 700827 / DSM 18053 / CIP 107007 / KCTC 52180 / NS114) TaxID=471854 RepID=C6W7C7_DYAFD|nr:beta-N-acetylhexosaminidase [Dyadobacter fermentans]ACT94405.1 Beta-N-acetylhexosaminidase [Dyadobacter fermentans DSM 18053]
MKRFLFGLICCMLVHSAFAQVNVIPKPTQVLTAKGAWALKAKTKIGAPADTTWAHVANMLAAQLGKATGQVPNIVKGKGDISLVVSGDASLGEEGYRLLSTPKGVTIQARTAKGAFYGVQTLLQLLPVEVFSETPVAGVKWTVPYVTIKDVPRYPYRGLMLDVCRHFMPIEFVKKYIDLIALHKQNQFHWHLTDDQGWRIEIKKYPELKTISSKRKETMKGHYRDQKFDGKPYEGFYTQDEIREVIKYAQDRFVNVIPEIEMPGHALAALAAYPQLGNNPDKIYEVGTKWGVYDDVFMPREETFKFLEDVLKEVIDLFPGKYIHIGGDECPKVQWKESRFAQDLIRKEGLKDEHGLQSYVIKRIDKFITSKGRRMIGWDEILEGGLSPNATVMSWRGIDGGIAAAKERHDVVMTPGGFCYLDHYQADPKTQPVAFGGFTDLAKSYSFEPTPEALSAEEARHILGVQGNVWTEYMKTPAYVQYMVWPRATALAEVGWTSKEGRNFEDFSKRLEIHKKRLDMLGVNYFGAPTNDKFEYVWPEKK